MLGNGSDELIHLMIQACARQDAPGGTVVLAPTPTFVMYEVFARLDGCRFVGVPLTADFGSMARRCGRRSRSTAGAGVHRLSEQPDRQLLRSGRTGGDPGPGAGLVVIDEAYLPFAQDTWMPQLAERSSLVVLRTLSKLGLAGLRLGYACADPAWIGEFDKLRPPYNVGVLPLAAADFLLDHFQVLQQQAAVIRAERARLLSALRALTGVAPFDSAANFILFRVGEPDRLFAGLCGRGILVKNVSGSHPLLAGCLRVTVARRRKTTRSCKRWGRCRESEEPQDVCAQRADRARNKGDPDPGRGRPGSAG